jgi:DNA-binding transcriptional LysR family regulator
MNDSLSGITLFARVVEAKSFSAAAEALGISKSLASRNVTALEESLAVKLLNRTTRKLSLTDAGAVFYEHCATILRQAETARRAVTESQDEPAGVVKLTAIPAFANRHVLPALVDFRRQQPKIQVKLSCTNRVVDLGSEGFDLGIRSQPPPPHLVARTLATSRLVLCASPAYLAQRGAPRRVEDLATHDCIVFPVLAPKGRWTFTRNRRKHSVAITPAMETDDMDTVRSAILAGLGVGLLPTHMAGGDLQRRELVPLLRPFDPGAGTLSLVYLPNRTLPSRVRVLIDFLIKRFGPTPPWDLGW